MSWVGYLFGAELKPLLTLCAEIPHNAFNLEAPRPSVALWIKCRTIDDSLKAIHPWGNGERGRQKDHSVRMSLCNPEILPILLQLSPPMRSQGRTCALVIICT